MIKNRRPDRASARLNSHTTREGHMFKHILIAVFSVALISNASAQIQDKPALLGEVQLYAMEDEAKNQWAQVLPKLQRDSKEYVDVWARLQMRLYDVRVAWEKAWDDVGGQQANSTLWRQRQEMSLWCYSLEGRPLPASDKLDQAAEDFAVLDVRIKLCRENLPALKDKVSSPTKQKDSKKQ